MTAKDYYDSAARKTEDMKRCRLCDKHDVTLHIISEEGKPDRVNPVCPHCFSEHVYDQDKNLQKVVTHIGQVKTRANAGGEGRGLPRTSQPPCSQVVCPLSATCKKDEDGCNSHCEPHAKGEGCDFGADGCPPCVPCVPCTANERSQPLDGVGE